MEQIIDVITQYADKWSWLGYTVIGFSGVGSLITSAKAIIKKTVTKADDVWLASLESKTWAKWIIGFFEFFSAVKVKDAVVAAVTKK